MRPKPSLLHTSSIKTIATNDLFYLGAKAVIRDEAGRVLLLKAKDYWDLPGGRIQVGETEEQALRREITEETGLIATNIGPHLGMCIAGARLSQPEGGQAGLIFSVYLCETTNSEVGISDEHIAFEWMSPAKASELLSGKFSNEICAAVAS